LGKLLLGFVPSFKVTRTPIRQLDSKILKTL
jgi:hypothetical protein